MDKYLKIVNYISDCYNKQSFNEFLYKLFCRVFLIDNVLNYDEEDRVKIYNFFNYFLVNKDNKI